MLALAAAISAESSGRDKEEHFWGPEHKFDIPWRGESTKAHVTTKAQKLDTKRRRRAALGVRCIETGLRLLVKESHKTSAP